MTWERAADLLKGPESRDYRLAMRCLLRANDEDVWRWYERRARRPKVEVREGAVVVRDEFVATGLDVRGDNHASPAATRVGPWQVDLRGARWRLSLVDQRETKAAVWDEVTVEFPGGWLDRTAKMPTASDADSVTWRRITSEPRPEVWLKPDRVTRAELELSVSPWWAWRESWGWLISAGMVALALALLPRPWSRAGAPGRPPLFLFVLPIVTSVVGCFREPLFDLADGPPGASVPDLVLLVDMSVWALICVAVAWFARLPRRPLIALAALAAGGYVSALAVGGVLDGPDGRPSDVSFGVLVPLGMSAGALGTLLWAGVLNGLRVGWSITRAAGASAKAKWPWVAGGGIAVATVVQYINADIGIRNSGAWLAARDSTIEEGSAANLLWLPVNMFHLASLWLWPLAGLTAVLVVLVSRPEGVDFSRRSPAAYVVGWVFAGNAFYWSVYFSGVPLPIPVLTAFLAIVFVFVLVQRWVVLERHLTGPPLRPGRRYLRLRDAVALVPLADVHDAAGRFFVLHRRGRRHDQQRPGEPLQDGNEEHDRIASAERALLRWPPGRGDGSRGAELPPGVTPFDVAMCVGPEVEPALLARYTARLAFFASLPVAGYFYWQEYVDKYWTGLSEGPLFGGAELPIGLAVEVLFWVFPGFLLGLLWRHLPGRSGPVKALPLALGYFAGAGVTLLGMTIANEPDTSLLMLRCGLLLALLTLLGLLVDLRTLRRTLPGWSRPLQFLMDAYRLDSFPTQLTFLLAQVAALLAIVQFVRSGGGEGDPQYPSIDPFQMGRPGG
ncbi:hypothetical protein E1264_07025 [Actinomadura sp. KC216]|nr:hypothetical protein E1264_07025 [Actinomadura sp. KC216]